MLSSLLVRRTWYVFLLLLSVAAAQLDNNNNDAVITSNTAAHVYADVGSNVSLPCTNATTNWPGNETVFMWIREGKMLHHSRVEKNGSLTLLSVSSRDAGAYQCKVDTTIPARDTLESRTVLHVKTPPLAPSNVTIYPSTVLALVMWKLGEDGGYPIKRVTVVYQKVTDDLEDPAWRRTYPEHIGPGMSQLEVYRLEPNTSYRFRVWATNKLGPGDYAEAYALTKPQGDHNGVGNPIIKISADFDTRIWVAAVLIVFGSLILLVIVLLGFIFVDRRFRRRRRRRGVISDDVELLTNITTNPTFGEETPAGGIISISEESSNDRQSLIKLNSYSVARPARL